VTDREDVLLRSAPPAIFFGKTARCEVGRLDPMLRCQMRIAMVALALLAHFDEPFGEPFAGNRGLSFTAPQNRSPSPIEPVSGVSETEIGKWRAETGAARPPVWTGNSGICRPESRARQPNPRECRQFSHSRKSNRRDRTGLEDGSTTALGLYA
jgi:hypothetical protein